MVTTKESQILAQWFEAKRRQRGHIIVLDRVTCDWVIDDERDTAVCRTHGEVVDGVDSAHFPGGEAMTAKPREGPIWDILRLSLDKDVSKDEFMNKAREVKETLEDRWYCLHHEAELLDSLVLQFADKTEWRSGLKYRKPPHALDTP